MFVINFFFLAFDLHFYGLKKQGAMEKSLKDSFFFGKRNLSHLIQMHNESYLKRFPRNQLVYLTRDSSVSLYMFSLFKSSEYFVS